MRCWFWLCSNNNFFMFSYCCCYIMRTSHRPLQVCDFTNNTGHWNHPSSPQLSEWTVGLTLLARSFGLHLSASFPSYQWRLGFARGQPLDSIKAIMAGFPHLEMGFKQTCKLCWSLLYGARTAQNSSSIWPQGLNQFCMNTHMMQLSSAKLIAKRLATKTHGFDLRSSQ